MTGILENNFVSSNESLTLALLALASLRVYLEIMGVDFSKLPATGWIFQGDYQKAWKFHRTGLYLSIGHILCFAPSYIF